MQKLEAELGVPLFERTGNHLSLNDNGKLAAEYARRILDEEAEMKNAVQSYERSKHTISVGYCAPGPAMIMPSCFTHCYPDTSVISRIDTEENLLKGLQSHTYQLIFINSRPDQTKYSSCYAMKEHLYFSVPPVHPCAFKEKEGTPASFMNGENFIMSDTIGIWDKLTREHLPDSHFYLQNSPEALRALASYSTLPAFSTDVTLRINGTSYRSGRINVPITDDWAEQKFYCAVLKEEEKRWKPFFNYLLNQDF